MFPLEVLGEPVWQRVTWTLLHFLWQGLAVAALVATLLYAWPVRRASHRYALCLAALIVMATCPLVTFIAIEVPEPGPEFGATGIRMGPTIPAVRVSQPPLDGSSMAVSPADAAPPDVQDAESLRVPVSWEARLQHGVDTIQPYWLIAWIAGVLVLATRLSFGWLHVRWLVWDCLAVPADLAARAATLGRRLGLRFPPRVCVSEKIREAIVVGLWRPLVLLPASWLTEMTPEVLEAVIAHELAHIRRWDLWVNLLQRLVETLLFYHPAVWWLSRRVSLEREMCTDELAVGATSERLAYATALEQIGRMRLGRTVPQFGATIGGSEMALLNRVSNVLGLSTSPGRARWWPMGLLAVAVPLGLWFASASSSPTRPSEARDAAQDEPAYTRHRERLIADSAAPEGQTEADDPWPKYNARCRTVLRQIATGQFAELESEFNTQMKQAFPASKLALASNPLREQLGDFDAIVAHHRTSTPGTGDYTSFELWAKFTKAKYLLKVDIVFDKAQKIAGLKLTATRATSAPSVAITSQQKAPVESRLPAKPMKSAEELASFLEKHPCEVGYFAKNLATGRTIDRFGDRPVCLAGIVKVFCLTELCRQVHENNLDLRQKIAVPEQGPVSLQEAADLMIGQSDNAATNALADFLGHDNINRIPALLGIDSLSAEILPEDGVLQKVLDRRIFGERIAAMGLPQHGTAKGIAEYFELLINRQVITEEVSDQIIEFFTRHPKPFSIHYAKEYTFAGKGGNILWTRPPKHYSMMGWGLFVQDRSGEYTVLCVWGEWFPENRPPPMQSEFLKYVTDCVISATGTATGDSTKKRAFTDSTGKFSVKAEYIGLRDGNVTLKKEDGTEISIPLAKFSEADRDWVRRQSQAERNEKKTQPDGT